jgi:hypothetical protein
MISQVELLLIEVCVAAAAIVIVPKQKALTAD